LNDSFGLHAINAIEVFDDGTEEALYVTGNFSTIDGVAANHVAKWDGVVWSGLSGGQGLGLDGPGHALAVWDDGTGASLYIGGNFITAGGLPANNIARWDGSDWSVVPGSSANGVDDHVHALEVWDDGLGDALYVGGTFENAGGEAATGIARWGFEGWSSLPDLQWKSVFPGGIFALSAQPGGALVAGGYFNIAGSTPAEYIASWDGSKWSALEGPSGNGLNQGPWSIATSIDSVFVGGPLYSASGTVSRGIAEYRCWSPMVFSDGFETGDTSAWK
jgi:hypothetical protein